MPPRYVVVDGSNIATEGRSIPSLAQLDEAVRAFMEERPTEQVIVVVDASFGYRIDESERNEYEAAEAAGEIVSPPAGAIGRGDGFLLRIADRTGAVVLSNDSFQEFHAEYGWLFDQGRLIGGKPVPGVGWIFTPRAPVRGPRSREAIRQAKRVAKSALKRAAVADGPVADAIAAATAEAVGADDAASPTGAAGDAAGRGNGNGNGSGDGDIDGDSEGGGGRRGRRRHTKPVGTVNDPLPFIQFIADHPLGSEIEGDVESFTSHGAFVTAGGARCYIPLVALGDPPPRSAKTVLKRGVPTTFVVQALDAPRRGIELALPGMARIAGVPTEETVEADIGAGRKSRKLAHAEAEAVPEPEAAPATEAKPSRKRTAKKAAAVAGPVPEPHAAETPKPARKRAAKKALAEAAVALAEEPEAVDAASSPAPAPAKARGRKKAVAPAVEADQKPMATEAVPAPAPKKAAGRKRAAAPVEEPAPEPGPIPAPRKRAAAKKAAAPVEEPPAAAPPPAPAPARRTPRKKAVAEPAAEAAPEAAPVKRARKRSAG